MGRDTWREAGLREDLMVEPVLLEGGDPVLLKAGLALADGLTTVSPTYARDLVDGDAGGVLHPWYEARAEDLVGVLNGIDPAVWNPATDPYLPAPYGVDDLSGKARCREALRSELGLERREGPLFGVVARLDPQKGLDLLLAAADRLLAESDGTLAVLGRGAPDIEEAIRKLARRHPGRVAPRFRFDAPLAHRIEAGADLFLMPSRFEPCGLNQMISQRYGTPPVARRTGGLADTIRAFGEHEAPDGFLFDAAEPEALLAAALEATRLWREEPETFADLRRRGMRRDHGWGARVDDYLAAYDRALEARRAGARDAVLDDLQLEPREPFLAPQRAIPTHYRRDLLRLMVVDPRRIHVYWEVQGEAGRAALEALTDEERWESRWELRCEELTSGARWTVAVEGIAKNWFLEVEADRRYRAELWMTAGGRDPVRFAGSGIVVTPPEAGA
ncbi:MAG: glycosyltransferase [Planctomycetota bacterium]